MAVNKKGTSSKTKTDEDDIRLDVDVWDVSIAELNILHTYSLNHKLFNFYITKTHQQLCNAKFAC